MSEDRSEGRARTGANGGSPDNGSEGGAQPPSGFTFADKRKIREDGPSVTPAAGPAAEPELIDGEVVGESPATEPEVDANVELAAERLADLQRLQAEYANYRKRVERDRAAARDLTIGSVIESLLPVLDDIQLARQHGDLESGPFASVGRQARGDAHEVRCATLR